MARKKKKASKKTKAKKTKAKSTARKTKKKAGRAAPAKRTKAKTKRAAPKAKAKAKPKAKPKKKTAAKKASAGEGNYAATRAFDKAETSFVKKNRKKIPAMAKEAEVALEGPQGGDLMAAEAEARAHGQGQPGDL